MTHIPVFQNYQTTCDGVQNTFEESPTLPLWTLSSIASMKAASLSQKHCDRICKLWNIVSVSIGWKIYLILRCSYNADTYKWKVYKWSPFVVQLCFNRPIYEFMNVNFLILVMIWCSLNFKCGILCFKLHSIQMYLT